MYSRIDNLTDRQINSFISFLIDGTDKAIIALEEVFGLDIDSSNSDIEIASFEESEFMVDESPIKIWCVISPTRVSFPQLLGVTQH